MSTYNLYKTTEPGNYVQEASTEKHSNKTRIYFVPFPTVLFNYWCFPEQQISAIGKSVTFKSEISFSFLLFIMHCF